MLLFLSWISFFAGLKMLAAVRVIRDRNPVPMPDPCNLALAIVAVIRRADVLQEFIQPRPQPADFREDPFNFRRGEELFYAVISR